MTRVLLGLGSNLGDRAAILQAAVDAIGATPGVQVLAVSAVYETAPVGGPSQDDFLNAVVAVETDLSPHALLDLALSLEKAAGRVRTVRWGPRSLDVDILHVDGVVVDEPDLVVPHPRMMERGFVLAPLADVAPDLVPASHHEWPGVRRCLELSLRTPAASRPEAPG